MHSCAWHRCAVDKWRQWIVHTAAIMFFLKLNIFIPLNKPTHILMWLYLQGKLDETIFVHDKIMRDSLVSKWLAT